MREDPANLRAHGLQGLRVVDNSITIGEKGADMIKQYWRQRSSRTAGWQEAVENRDSIEARHRADL